MESSGQPEHMSTNKANPSSRPVTPQASEGKRAPSRKIFQSLFKHTILVLVAAAMMLPFVWMLLASFKPLTEIDAGGFFPHIWRGQNYPAVFHAIAFGKYYFNSIFVAAWVTFLQVITSAMAAYAFARLKWRGRNAVFLAYLTTLMVPGVVTMIPNYALMAKLHLLDSYTGLILPAAFSAFGTFLLRQFMLSIPGSLDEAAAIDGASKWRIFWEVILPLTRPGLVALAILTFLGNYQSFFWPLVLIKSEALRTLPIGMMFFDTIYGRQTNLIMAASVMAVVPLVILFIAGQKQLVKGIQLGAVKG